MYFHRVKDPEKLLPILEERLPKSCFIHNQAKFSHKFKDDLIFYVLSEEINSQTWIVTDYSRQDYNHNICISAPNSIVTGEKKVSEEIRECFASTSAIKWDEELEFVGLERPVSSLILDVCVNIKGNVSEVHPDILFYMEKAEALNISLGTEKDFEIRPLDLKTGTDFISSTWIYSKEGSRQVISKCIEANPSSGIYIGSDCASGVILVGDGLLHCLYTKREYRKRGFGKITMLSAFKAMAEAGYIPCSTSEVRNYRSVQFHKTLGVKKLLKSIIS